MKLVRQVLGVRRALARQGRLGLHPLNLLAWDQVLAMLPDGLEYPAANISANGLFAAFPSGSQFAYREVLV